MTRNACRALRAKGYSIGQIAARLRRSESTVHWHVKDIPLTHAQRKRLHQQWRLVMVRVNAKRRGVPLKPVAFHRPRWSRQLVRLVSHLSFDGRVDRYGCSYYNRSLSQVNHVGHLLRELLGITPKLHQNPNGVWRASYYHVEVASWLLEKEQQLLGVVRRHKSWQREWLKALFDDEGHVHWNGSIRRVRASQDCPTVLVHAGRFLKSSGIESRVDKGAKAIEVTGRNNLIAFQRRINFSSGITVNGRRKNGLSNTEIDKRDLLEAALNSYV